MSSVSIQRSPIRRSLVELFAGASVPTNDLFLVSTLVERALIAVALADTPVVPLFTVDSRESILDAPADPEP